MRRFLAFSSPGDLVTTRVFSFHTMRDACLAGDPRGWGYFVKLYSPLARHLLRHYFSTQTLSTLLPQVFREATAGQGRIWKNFAGTDEKEFVFYWRGFVVEQGRQARGAPPRTPVTSENFWALLETFPPLQRELLILGFRHYSPEQLSDLTKFTPESAANVLQQARQRLAQKLGNAGSLERGDHDALFAAIEQQHGEKCYPHRLFVRMADGQITWREREDAERHLQECLHCLDRLAQYREASRFFHVLPPADANAVRELLAELGLPAVELGEQRSWWQRLLGG